MTRIIIIFFIYINILAQTSAYQSAEATANLIMPLSIEAVDGSLDFGEIVITNSPRTMYLAPEVGKKFIVKGDVNRSVVVTYNDVQLNNNLWVSNFGGINGNLTFIPEVKLKNLRILQSGSTIFLDKVGFIGKTEINVGGTIEVPSNQPVGNYTGSFIITITY